MLSLFKSCGICKIAIPPVLIRGTIPAWLGIIWNVPKRGYTTSVLIVFKGNYKYLLLHPQVAKTNQ
jgi:hypothetical protein